MVKTYLMHDNILQPSCGMAVMKLLLHAYVLEAHANAVAAGMYFYCVPQLTASEYHRSCRQAGVVGPWPLRSSCLTHIQHPLFWFIFRKTPPWL
jgi:hypothetical protein